MAVVEDAVLSSKAEEGQRSSRRSWGVDVSGLLTFKLKLGAAEEKLEGGWLDAAGGVLPRCAGGHSHQAGRRRPYTDLLC